MLEIKPDFDIAKLIPALLGAAVSIKFVHGTWYQILGMLVGGVALSYYSTDWVAGYLSLQDAKGMVGFGVGLFGMVVVDKIYQALEALDAKQMAADAWTWLTRKWKA